MALQVEGLAVGRLTLGTELCVIDGGDVGIGLDAYLGGTGPGIAVGLFGYAVGTYLGFGIAKMLLLMA